MIKREEKLPANVYLIIHKHQAYVSEVIEGLLWQKTSFDFEFIIEEDHSNDNKQQIKSLENKFVNNSIHLPIAQKYSLLDKQFIENKIKAIYERK